MKVVLVIVTGFNASLKVAMICALIGTFVSPFAGVVKLTVGGVVSGAALAVKVQTKLVASALPARSVAPVVMVAV